jgi:hypothetical protein
MNANEQTEYSNKILVARNSLHILDGMEELFANQPCNQTAEGMVSCFRIHRFLVITWLLENGVAIPVHLLDDRTHART